MHLPHIVKQIAKSYRIALGTKLVFIEFHGISGIQRLSLYSGRQARRQATTLYMHANLIQQF